MVIIGIICLGLFSSLTILTHIALGFGILRCVFRERIGTDDSPGERAGVSVVIPAKDEVKNLPRLLGSLEHQTRRDLQIVLVNDRSRDATGDIMADFHAKYPDRVRIVTLKMNPDAVNPKKYALERGIEAASGDILLFTDADCVLPEGWAESMARRFAETSRGIVIAPVHTHDGFRFLDKYQLFDHVFRYFYTAGSAGIGLSTGGFGNNLGVTRRALESIGGYGNIDPSVTEDAALIAAIRENSPYTVHAAVYPDLLVNAEPQTTWRDLFRQEMRWSSGAFFSRDPGTVLGYAAVMIYLFGGLAAVPLSFLFPPFLFVAASTFLSMFTVAFSGGVLLRLKPRMYWFFVLPSILWSSIFYTAVNIAALLGAPIRWKGAVVSGKK
jgi:cellulose synthase/poly-beta-1,6-N-acetylglucosamine synthase-like glycosyltransferase